MMSLNIELLKRSCEVAGVPGYEQRIRALIIETLQGHVDDLYTDAMGNVISLIKGKKPKKMMLAAHMDEIGFMVKHIDEHGFLFFQTLGGFDPKTLTAQRVIVHGKKDLIGVMGSKPIHLMNAEERKKLPEISDYFIDMGMDRKSVRQYINIGDPISRERNLIEMGDMVNCKSIDNRVSVYMLMEAMMKLKDPPYDTYGVFTVQEELGIRGALVAAHSINPDFGLALDTTIAYDVPNAKPEEMITLLGDGPAIKIMDSSAISDYRMVKYLKNTADKHNIKWQPEVLPAGGTDTAAMQRMSRTACITGAISIPTRHLHQVIETASKQDIVLAIDLILHSIQEIDTFDWLHQ